jgi:DNA-binding FadR family transcriptional regulator
MSEPGSLLRSLGGRPAARNFHNFVINDIGFAIVSGKYPVGSVLPNDAEMMSRFGVSRTVLREALKTLESKGLVEARPKVGTRVSAASRWNIFDGLVAAWTFQSGLDGGTLGQLRDFRLATEPLIVEAVVRNRTADDVRMLQYWVRQMEKSQQSALGFALADFEFHAILVDVSKNPFARSSLTLLELAHAAAYRRIVETGARVDEKVLAAHKNMLTAVEKKDGTRLAEAMRRAAEHDHASGLATLA